MNNATELPMALYKANLGFQVKLCTLLHASGQNWLEFANRLAHDGITELNAEAEELLKTQEWQKLPTQSAESLWRQLQQRFGDGQTLTQIAIDAQTAFASGLQSAVQEWQKETTEALSGAVPSAPAETPPWPDLFKLWSQLLPPAPPPAKAPAKRPAAVEAR